LPTDASVAAASSANDTCSATTISASHTDSTTGCATTRDCTEGDTDARLNERVADGVYSWTTDTTGPSLTVPTTGLVLGCHPGTLPTDASVAGAADPTSELHSRRDSVSRLLLTTNSATTRDFTVTAKDACLH